jgi:hypothetical protein
MRYESREGLGAILIAKPDHLAITTVIQLEQPFLVTEFRRVRKLLEMCRGELSVLTDSRYVWGLGNVVKNLYFPATAEVRRVRFRSHGPWQLTHLDLDLMDVPYGEPTLPQPPADVNAVKAQITGKFPSVQPGAADALVNLVSFAVEAKHGTMLVISGHAAEEAARLTKPKRGVRPFAPDEATIAAAAAIDGAIMIDLEGMAHGIGVILDGLAGDSENPARGARYNSAIRYLHGHQDSLIVVVSEDGMVDIVTLPTPVD